MPVVWKGGPGHKAPYRTTHVRVPEPIKAAVQEMCDDFKRGALIDAPATVSADRHSDLPAEPLPAVDYSEAIAILEKALTLKANAGGAIKKKIREAIAILTGED